jgi:undecaprenyl diphosphate synthase
MTNTSDQLNVPRHLGLILDGHRRWAKKKGIPQLEGHRQGYKHIKEIGFAALERGVKVVSAFGFSTENWKRDPEEVTYLMDLFEWVLTHEVDEMHEKNVRVRWLGSKERLKPRTLQLIEAAEAKTADNTGGVFAIAVNYGGQQEIADAAAKLIKAGVNADDVTPEKFSQYLYAPEVPPVDLLIRTSGEQRISGFMLYRADYAELMFIDKHWPDFSLEDLDLALTDFASRQRRFGN